MSANNRHVKSFLIISLCAASLYAGPEPVSAELPSISPSVNTNQTVSSEELPYICVRGIMFDADKPFAIVNDRVVEEGNTVDGITILAINPMAIRCQYNGKIFERVVNQGCQRSTLPVLRYVDEEKGKGREGRGGLSLKKIFRSPALNKIKATRITLHGTQWDVIRNRIRQNSILILGLFVALHVYIAFALQTIARKTSTSNGWFAWFPILNIFLICSIAKKPGWFWLLNAVIAGFVFSFVQWPGQIFFPFYAAVLIMIIVLKLCAEVIQARNKPPWLAIFLFLPIINIFVLHYVAFSKDVERDNKELEK